MATFAWIAMRVSMMGVILLITGGAFLAARTSFQHVTIALFIFLYCAIRYVGLSVIERSELLMPYAAHSSAELVRLRDERRRSRLQTTLECGLLAVLWVYAALKVVSPGLLVH